MMKLSVFWLISLILGVSSSSVFSQDQPLSPIKTQIGVFAGYPEFFGAEGSFVFSDQLIARLHFSPPYVFQIDHTENQTNLLDESLSGISAKIYYPKTTFPVKVSFGPSVGMDMGYKLSPQLSVGLGITYSQLQLKGKGILPIRGDFKVSDTINIDGLSLQSDVVALLDSDLSEWEGRAYAAWQLPLINNFFLTTVLGVSVPFFTSINAERNSIYLESDVSAPGVPIENLSNILKDRIRSEDEKLSNQMVEQLLNISNALPLFFSISFSYQI